MNSKAILLLSCPDQKGLVSRISGYIYNNSGNIITLSEHVDPNEGMFFCRVVWDMKEFKISRDNLEQHFGEFASEFDATWQIHYSSGKMKVAIFVSKYEHCLQELLWRQAAGDLPAEIVLIISNHSDLKNIADMHRIPFHLFPVTTESKIDVEQQEIQLLKDHDIDTVILARYMQVLSDQFVKAFPNRIINIHHSFLPAFSGGSPYRQAYQRGVKIIGATSHYVTEILDDGPIIEQDVIRISHRDTVDDLVRKGRDLERIVLARAVYYHVLHRVLVNGKKTIVFE